MIDATGLVVGRLASIVAMRLRGKHKPSYTPHVDDGDNVIVVNAAKVVLTGRKREQKIYYHHTGYHRRHQGAHRAARSWRASFPSASSKRRSSACCRADRSARVQFGNLRVYPGPEHPHEAQKPETLDIAAMNRKNTRSRLTMAETMQSLDSLAALKPAAPEAPKYVKKVDKQGRAYATGKRKNAVARVWIKPGAGKIEVNTRPVEVFFARPVLRMLIQQPLVATNRNGQYDVICTVSGGGLSGQAGAVRHGLSKALTYFEPDLRGVLKRGGFLTRDPRVVERKKYGTRQGAPLVPVLQALDPPHPGGQ